MARPFQQRAAQLAGAVDQIGPLLGAAPGEAVGEGFLLVAEHVDRQWPAAREHLAGGALAGEAEQHQRRREGHRVEGADGGAHRPAVGVPGGDDGDAGGKQAEDPAEQASVKGRPVGGGGRDDTEVLLALGRRSEQLRRDRAEARAALAPLRRQARDAEAAAIAVEDAERQCGPIDILVNCAGAAKRTPPDELTPKHWHEAMEAKFFTYIHLIDPVVKRMAARGAGDAAGGHSTAAASAGADQAEGAGAAGGAGAWRSIGADL